jgi:hypothetical protein
MLQVGATGINQPTKTMPILSYRYELYVRAPESQASPESHFTVWSPYLWMATLATMVLLIMAMRIMYNYGAFEENRGSCSHIQPLYHLHKEQDRLGNANLGICILSVLGSVGSEGKSFPHKSYSKNFYVFFNSSHSPYKNLCEHKMFLMLILSDICVKSLRPTENSLPCYWKF